MIFKKGQILNFKCFDTIYGKLILIGNLISYGERGYTHSAIIYDVKKDSITIAEALGKGFTISDYDTKWLNDKIKEGVIDVGESKIKLIDIQKNIKKYEGLPYGWMDILRCVGYIIFGKQLIKWNDGTKHLICSEAVSRILYDSSNKQIDFSKEFKKSYDIITPEDLSRSKYIKWLTD